ncbi:toll/interleukin-1 receptor domain-containing protein [Afifella pfennigii]|uniref:toll/interleukin-1 receptor domain-containing protein n=1 Tax=Afifella pfennigii TaxID=209897 RepID=UPI000690908C|nr:toll/interleukin-1 receptor domain-containing protein [Afifella pfennigii]
MSSINQSQISRLSKEIADLRKADAREAKKEADLLAKINRANDSAARTKSLSTLQSKAKEAERATRDLAGVQKKRADIAGKIAEKSKSLRSYEDRQAKEDEKQRKKMADEQKRLIRERETHERRVSAEIRSRRVSAPQVESVPDEQQSHDFFISHASEDKDGFVRALAEALQERGASVWYDEFTLKVGDSLRRNIDRGLAGSRFGVVVLSEHFFGKEWPNKELDGLVALEVQGQTRILPIWHKVSKDEVARFSPTLADCPGSAPMGHLR